MIEVEKRPEVSVIVLTYNQADTVGRALDSIVGQRTDFDFEVLVADDCSTDATPEVIAEYAARYPKLIKVVPRFTNMGLVDNYFDVFSRCRGRFIADCAGDDAWHGTDRLQKLYDIINANPDMTLVHSQWLERDEASGSLTLPDYSNADPSLYAPVVDGYSIIGPLLEHRHPTMVHLSTALYRRKVLRYELLKCRAMIHNPDFGIEDLPLMLALAHSGDVGYLACPTLEYTVGGDTISSSRNLERAMAYAERVARATYQLAEYYMVGRRRVAPYLRARMAEMASVARKTGSRALAERCRLLSEETGVSLPMKARLNLVLCALTNKK